MKNLLLKIVDLKKLYNQQNKFKHYERLRKKNGRRTFTIGSEN